MLWQIPHAFQQKLSAEKTPTLAYAIPSFEAMILQWSEMKLALANEGCDELCALIDVSIQKLEDYQEWTDMSPAYVLAMSWFSFFLSP